MYINAEKITTYKHPHSEPSSKIFPMLLAIMFVAGIGFINPDWNIFIEVIPEISEAANDLFGKIDANGNATFKDSAVSKSNISDEFRKIAVWISTLMSIFMLVCMLWQIAKLGASGDNEQARKKASMGILTSGIALALFGGSSVVVAFFWNILNEETE